MKDSSTLPDRAFFHNLAHITGQTDQIFMKIYHKCNSEQGSPRLDSTYRLAIWTRFALAEVCVLRVLNLNSYFLGLVKETGNAGGCKNRCCIFAYNQCYI